MKIKSFTPLIAFFVICFFATNKVKAQFISPQDGEYLNFTDVLFEVEQVKNATHYLFTFYECDKRNENCKEIKQIKSKHRSLVVNNFFDFNKNYSWQFVAYNNKKEVYSSRKSNFMTGYSNLLDTTLQRWEWQGNMPNRKDGILLIDGLKLAINMQGKPVFYLNYNFDHTVRDINITPQGTITLVDNRMGEIKEISLRGEMLWLGPENNGRENNEGDKFHHEFEKLTSFNYLVAGKRKLENIETPFDFSNISNKTVCETIIEFDTERNEVWRFNLLPELKKQFNIAPTSQMFNPDRLGHLNGLAADEKNKIIYASFKTFSSVFKIDKVTNNILYMYGNKKINFNDSLQTNGSFEQQHCPVFGKNGNLLILNNGNEQTGSGIVELNTKENLNEKNEVVRSVYFKNILKKNYYTAQMGSVQYLDKNNVLVGLGNAGNLFELNLKRKKLNWQLYTFQNTKWNEKRIVWKPLVSYRVYYYKSLFPYYFIVNKIEDSKYNKIEIVNIGSENETYKIEVFDQLNECSLTNYLYLKAGKTKYLKYEQNTKKLIISGERSGKKVIIE